MAATIKPCLWFDGRGAQAARSYRDLFPRTTLSGPGGIVTELAIDGQEFMFLDGGPLFAVNQTLSFSYHCADAAQLDALWARLAPGAEVLMPVDAYPFAPRYGWLADRFGVHWQLICGAGTARQTVVPALMFANEACGRAEEAMAFYVGVFPDAELGAVSRYGEGRAPDRPGSVNYGEFKLCGRWFTAMDSAHAYAAGFTEGESLAVSVDGQDEVDYFWDALVQGGTPGRCGWLKDRFGLSWQVVPRRLGQLLADPGRAERVTAAFMAMGKFDIAALERA